jgi:hypothetical protein
MDIPKELKGGELFKFLKENKEDIFYSKKSILKEATAIHVSPIVSGKTNAEYSNKGEYSEEEGVIKRRLIINTTNVMDSHKDVHYDGIWTKSLLENTRIKLYHAHRQTFKDVIADKGDLEVSSNMVSWKSLGFDFEGKTDALTFDATIRRSRNPEMFKEYEQGNVDEHSVGMRYIKMALAINSEDEQYLEEKKEWDNNIAKIVNREEVEKQNYFFGISEAKAIEGSAVPAASNPFTPTQVPKQKEQKTEVKKTGIDLFLES